MAGQPTPTPPWKQEVNRRVAAHKNRRGPSTPDRETPAEIHHGPGNRAAQAAARVAARYAQAPSYSQMQAAEARTAIRAAEIATQVALEAQANARAVLAGLKANGAHLLDSGASASAHLSPAATRGTRVKADPAETQPAHVNHKQPHEIRWETELPAVPASQPAAQHPQAPHIIEGFAGPAREWGQMSNARNQPIDAEQLDRLEAALPDLLPHANLIEFPHETAAPRKAPPRSSHDSYRAPDDPDRALSIFEVDPGTVTLEAAAETTWEQPVAFQWTGIELEPPLEEDTEPVAVPASEAPVIQLAPFSQRLMAAIVDTALVSAAFLVAALLALANVSQPPSLRLLEVAAVAGFLAAALLYQALFFTLADATPGTKYARISLCTFDDQTPTPTQLQRRLGASLLSVLPLGLGVAWALFDEQHLSWHDRYSGTYQRKCGV